jgi:hypothetical protein
MFPARRAIGFTLTVLFVSPAFAATIYNNLTPNGSMAMASNPGGSEIEAADDFILSSTTLITSASFTGLITGTTSLANITDVVAEIYRVFPLDSTSPPSGNVPTRNNSPSDVAFATRDSAASELTFATTLLSSSFSANNSVGPGGIHVNTGGSGAISGQEVQFNVNFSTPLLLPAGHYFFIPQVAVTGGQFYWLSATRPAAITPDLQTWIRDSALQPDWLRVGTDIVGGTTPPTFNAAFSLDGTVVPEPSTVILMVTGGLAVLLRKKIVTSARRRPR